MSFTARGELRGVSDRLPKSASLEGLRPLTPEASPPPSTWATGSFLGEASLRNASLSTGVARLEGGCGGSGGLADPAAFFNRDSKESLRLCKPLSKLCNARTCRDACTSTSSANLRWLLDHQLPRSTSKEDANARQPPHQDSLASVGPFLHLLQGGPDIHLNQGLRVTQTSASRHNNRPKIRNECICHAVVCTKDLRGDTESSKNECHCDFFTVPWYKLMLSRCGMPSPL